MTEEEKDAYIKKLVQSNIDQHNKITALSKKVYDLQKENAELRAKESFVGDQNRKLCEQQQKVEVLEVENAELKKLKRECETSLCRAEYQYNYEQLTKAKEIIKELLDFDFLPDIEIKKQAEQFLKDQEEEPCGQ